MGIPVIRPSLMDHTASFKSDTSAMYPPSVANYDLPQGDSELPPGDTDTQVALIPMCLHYHCQFIPSSPSPR